MLRLKRILHLNNHRKRVQLKMDKIQFTLILRMPSRCLVLQVAVDEDICSTMHLDKFLFKFVYTISEDPAESSYTERAWILEQTDPKLRNL